jgi:hypothetical protein
MGKTYGLRRALPSRREPAFGLVMHRNPLCLDFGNTAALRIMAI